MIGVIAKEKYSMLPKSRCCPTYPNERRFSNHVMKNTIGIIPLSKKKLYPLGSSATKKTSKSVKNINLCRVGLKNTFMYSYLHKRSISINTKNVKITKDNEDLNEN
jgi:hypothetical protein